MCGGTWPLNRGEPLTRTDKRIPLDGADNLVDAPPTSFFAVAQDGLKRIQKTYFKANLICRYEAHPPPAPSRGLQARLSDIPLMWVSSGLPTMRPGNGRSRQGRTLEGLCPNSLAILAARAFPPEVN
jgi:hypothetical protein